MKRLSFVALLLLLPFGTLAWAQADTLPDGQGKEIQSPEGLRKVIERKDPPSKDKYLVVYCRGGMKAPVACEKLQADGYKHVFVWGGIVKWPYPREVSTK
jgi:rhodanese-related sulfurtransferase